MRRWIDSISCRTRVVLTLCIAVTTILIIVRDLDVTNALVALAHSVAY
jgi:hypothetical protein